MFKSTKDFGGRPESEKALSEKEWILELRFYLSLFQLISIRLEALQIASTPESEQTERNISLILLLQSMQNSVNCLSNMLSEKHNTPASSPSDEPPCKS